jgi:hypothetical protein
MAFDEFGIKVEIFFLQVRGVIVKRKMKFGNVFVLVCYFNGNLLKNLRVLCVSLFY